MPCAKCGTIFMKGDMRGSFKYPFCSDCFKKEFDNNKEVYAKRLAEYEQRTTP